MPKPRSLSPLDVTTAGEGRGAHQSTHILANSPKASPELACRLSAVWDAGADEAQAHEARDARQKKFRSDASHQGRQQEPATPNRQTQNSGDAGDAPATADKRAFLVRSPAGAKGTSMRHLYALTTFKTGAKTDHDSCQDGSTNPT
eukprot:COSAG02_NODE_16736_length_1059_cov_2.441667_2_plen_145_part_01